MQQASSRGSAGVGGAGSPSNAANRADPANLELITTDFGHEKFKWVLEINSGFIKSSDFHSDY